MFKRLWQCFKQRLGCFFKVSAQGVAQAVLDRLNDPELQQAAYEAVAAAAMGRFRGDEAFEQARAELGRILKREGRELKDAVADTLLQNAYLVFKNR